MNAANLVSTGLAALTEGAVVEAERRRPKLEVLVHLEGVGDHTFREYGPEHYEEAINLNNRAALKAARGQRAEAEPLYRRALALKEKLLGSGHPDVAMTLNNLAVLYKAQGKYAEAEAMYDRALAIFEQSLESEHPKIGACRKNRAALAASQQGLR